MSFKMEKGRFYVMPVVFGPTTTPRQAYSGQRCCYLNPIGTHYDHYKVVVETDAEYLERILPEGFSLLYPYMIVTFSHLTNCAFLAGRGYELIAAEIPVRFKGAVDDVKGVFLSVMWEDHGDNCNIGREQSGFAKVFGDIKAPEEKDNKAFASCSTWGHKFLEMNIDFDQNPEDMEEMIMLTQNHPFEGRLHYKYMPKTGEPWGEVDAEYVTFSPYKWDPEPGFDESVLPRPSFKYGKGNLKWFWAEWHDAPTQVQIIQYFCNMPVKRYVGAVKHSMNTLQDIRNNRILR